jgi:glycosidase
MPIHPIGQLKRKGTWGSPYSVKDYYAVNPDLGTLTDLISLVKNAHEKELKVILDWVPNHTSWDAKWMRQHPEFYTQINGQFTTALNEHGEPTDWYDTADLDYTNPQLRKAMIDAMVYWVKELDIDGFRVDMAGLIPRTFWQEVRPALAAVKPLFMLSEWQDEPDHFASCFHANYGWKWKDVTRNIASGIQDATALDTLKTFLDATYINGYCQVYFTQNHDENAWAGTEKELYGASADAFNVLMYTWQGIPMIHNGQEDGLDKRLSFFERDPIQWKDYHKAPFFQFLNSLKKNNRAIWCGNAGGALKKIKCNQPQHVYAFSREKEGDKVVVVLNLSNTSRSVSLFPDGSQQGAYLNVFGSSTVEVTPEMNLRMEPWEYLLLTNK